MEIQDFRFGMNVPERVASLAEEYDLTSEAATKLIKEIDWIAERAKSTIEFHKDNPNIDLPTDDLLVIPLLLVVSSAMKAKEDSKPPATDI